ARTAMGAATCAPWRSLSPHPVRTPAPRKHVRGVDYQCFPNTVCSSRVSETKECSKQNCKRDHATTKRQHPFNKWTRSSKHPATDHHPALPSIELVKRNHISDREREIECAKQRAPR